MINHTYCTWWSLKQCFVNYQHLIWALIGWHKGQIDYSANIWQFWDDCIDRKLELCLLGWLTLNSNAIVIEYISNIIQRLMNIEVFYFSYIAQPFTLPEKRRSSVKINSHDVSNEIWSLVLVRVMMIRIAPSQ